VDNLILGYPQCPQLGEKLGTKRRGLGDLWTMWTIWTVQLNRWLTTFAHEDLYKKQSLAIYLF